MHNDPGIPIMVLFSENSICDGVPLITIIIHKQMTVNKIKCSLCVYLNKTISLTY